MALSLDDAAAGEAQSLRGAAGGARPGGGLPPGPRRRRAGAGLGDRGLGHRGDAGRARPVLLLRPEPRRRPVAGGRGWRRWATRCGCWWTRAAFRALFDRHPLQHDRAPVDRVAARARERRRAATRFTPGWRRRSPASRRGAGDGARAGAAGAGRRAGGPRGRGRAGARPQRFSARLPRRRGGPSPFDRGSPFEHFVAETYGRMGVPAAGHARRGGRR